MHGTVINKRAPVEKVRREDAHASENNYASDCAKTHRFAEDTTIQRTKVFTWVKKQ